MAMSMCFPCLRTLQYQDGQNMRNYTAQFIILFPLLFSRSILLDEKKKQNNKFKKKTFYKRNTSHSQPNIVYMVAG